VARKVIRVSSLFGDGIVEQGENYGRGKHEGRVQATD